MERRRHSQKYITKWWKRPGHPMAFSSPTTLARYYKITLKKAREYLARKDAFTRHAEARRPRIRNPYFIHFKVSKFLTILTHLIKYFF